MSTRVVKKIILQTWPVGVLAIALAALSALGVRAPNSQAVRFRQTNLVSDQPRVALMQDNNLVNAWGVSFSPDSPFWVSDNGTGLATLYTVTNDSSGVVHVVKNPLEVRIPGTGNPTGQLFNDTTAFRSNLFIFASEDGTISGWRPELGTNAETLVIRPTAVYKGITLATNANGPVLLAANFREGTIDVYDGNLVPVAQLSDPTAPAGFAPFNVQSREGMIFVTFAKQDADKHDDVPGSGNGLIDIFDPLNGTFNRFATGSNAEGANPQLNSPWGVAVTPGGFGLRASELLVGNFGSGTIMRYDANGQFLGLLIGANGRPIAIDGLWALTFGNGGQAGGRASLFFSAGPDNEKNGLFGRLDPIVGDANGIPK